tara:strand:- start:184 stop:600 length:417 start_codon:yes stop_codon:yes gene_type:complete
MSHFAEIDENNIVLRVMVGEQDWIDTQEGTWVQTSYNTFCGIHYGQDREPDGGIALRGNFAGIGFHYDPVNDFFYPERPTDREGNPFASWVLSLTEFYWKAPIPYPNEPTDEIGYYWDEDVYQADNTQGWIEHNYILN